MAARRRLGSITIPSLQDTWAHIVFSSTNTCTYGVVDEQTCRSQLSSLLIAACTPSNMAFRNLTSAYVAEKSSSSNISQSSGIQTSHLRIKKGVQLIRLSHVYILVIQPSNEWQNRKISSTNLECHSALSVTFPHLREGIIDTREHPDTIFTIFNNNPKVQYAVLGVCWNKREEKSQTKCISNKSKQEN